MVAPTSGAAAAAFTPASAARWWPMLAALALLALVLRILGYSGFFGSDEVTYIASAFRPLDGDWTLDDYVGANRIGVNLPMAAFAALLGRNEWGVAAYGLVCSVAEVVLLAWVAFRVFGWRVGVAAGLLLATLPTHVHLAGRVLADPPLALLITASFVLFLEGELRRWSMGYFLAGVCAGLSFLVKPVTLFVFGVLLAWPLVARRWDWRWMWMAAGLLVAMAANGLAYQALTGRFWYVFEVVRERRQSGYLEAGAAAGEIQSQAFMYFEYLFVRMYHTGLVGWLALAALVMLVLRRPPHAADGAPGRPLARRFVFTWAIGLIVILSFLPVSVNPFLLVPKQTNYMLMFVAPLCLLAALGLERLPVRVATAALALTAAVGLGFALLLQAVVAVFTANSWATLDFVRSQPAAPVYLMSNAYRAAQFERLVLGRDVLARVRPVQELKGADAGAERIVIVDEQTFEWDDSAPWTSLAAVPACWRQEGTLQGRAGGLGVALVSGVRAVVSAAGLPPKSALSTRLRSLAEPAPARVYRLAPGCV